MNQCDRDDDSEAGRRRMINRKVVEVDAGEYHGIVLSTSYVSQESCLFCTHSKNKESRGGCNFFLVGVQQKSNLTDGYLKRFEIFSILLPWELVFLRGVQK